MGDLEPSYVQGHDGRVQTPEPVIIARGSSPDDLERLARLLQDARVPFDVQEELGEDPANPDWHWAVLVLPSEVDTVRRVLASGEQGPPPAPGSAPLFEAHGAEAVRVILMLTSFGLAGGLWLQSCAT